MQAVPFQPARRPALLRAPRPEPVPRPPLVRPEAFRDRVEAELARHQRYLVPLGFLRIGSRRPGELPALHEIISMELRRTDAASVQPDGSCAVLALHAEEHQLRAIALRVMAEAAGIHSVTTPPDLFAAVLPIRSRREEPDLLWLALSKAYENGRTGSARIILAR